MMKFLDAVFQVVVPVADLLQEVTAIATQTRTILSLAIILGDGASQKGSSLRPGILRVSYKPRNVTVRRTTAVWVDELLVVKGCSLKITGYREN